MGQGKNRLIVVSAQNTESLFLYRYLLIIVLLSIQTTVTCFRLKSLLTKVFYPEYKVLYPEYKELLIQ